MGLLDEAIRDHLELKRRRGADPTEIARAEREALEPVFPGEPVAVAADGEGAATALIAPAEHPALAQPVPDPAFSTLGQETAELDVEAYMDGVDADGATAAAGGAPPPAEVPGVVPLTPRPDAEGEFAPPQDQAPGAIADELLEWEDPRDAPPEPPAQIPGQESLSLE